MAREFSKVSKFRNVELATPVIVIDMLKHGLRSARAQPLISCLYSPDGNTVGGSNLLTCLTDCF